VTPTVIESVDSADAYRRPVGELVAGLGTDDRLGLSEAEAQSRRQRYGPNELVAEKPAPKWRLFAAQFANTLVVLLLVATIISFVLWLIERDSALPYEAIAIFAIVLLNAAIGFFQESRAEEAVAALRAMSAARASVIRAGERRAIDAVELVPGDLILIAEGDTVPADARVIESVALQTSEAALTGESFPVDKRTNAILDEVSPGDRDNMIFSGTAATYGHGKAVVTATGMQTEIGRIAGLLRETPEEPTPLQREIDRTGRTLGLVVVAIAIVMIATILLVEDVHGTRAVLEVLILGVALAIAAVPEGLPAVVTAVLAKGVHRMARRNAIVRHMAAVETLGSATVIASDKTGTLTKNEMTVRVVITASGRASFGGSGYAPAGDVRAEDGGPVGGPLRAEVERTLSLAERANNASLGEREGRWTIQGDPTEAALLVAARKAGLHSTTLEERLPRIGEVPFSAQRRLMSTVHRDANGDGRGLVCTKGAPDVVLARCTHEMVGEGRRLLAAARRSEILETNEALAAQALRTLGVAGRWTTLAADATESGAFPSDIENDLVFAGLVGILDPPRPEAKEAVARAIRAGIRPLMITGDHPRTAAVIAKELGISEDGRALTGAEFASLSPPVAARAVGEASVYARVSPEDKLRIVDALRRNGEVVAMTGDGVNDAPALKAADIGVAMAVTGTDVSREAADIVLADDNFASIVAAVEEGRRIFANIRKFLRYLLSSNTAEGMTMFFGVVLARQLGLTADGDGVVLPLLATQILWINLITDGAPALALGVDPADEASMQNPPRPAGEGINTPRMWRGIAFVGLVVAAGTLGVLDASLPGGLVPGTGSLRHGQTMAFTTLVFFQLFNAFNARSDERSAFAGMFTNPWLWASIAGSLVLQALVVYVPFLQRAFGTAPISPGDWIVCLGVASSVLWLMEGAKLVGRLRAAAVAAPHETTNL